MADNKKKFTEPEIKAVEIEQADIICASTGYNDGPMLINGGYDLELGQIEW